MTGSESKSVIVTGSGRGIGRAIALRLARDGFRILVNDFVRYLSYPLWIWLVEILVGVPAKQIGIKIWDYSYLPDQMHWKGIISFIHFPVWILFGVLVEMVDKLF